MQKIENTTLITVTFNSAHCIPVLAPLLQNFKHAFLVDNGSDDETVKIANQLIPEVEVICNQSNLGFGAANNRALEKVKTPYALLLNPDCVASVEAVQGLLSIAEKNPTAAIFAPHLIRRDNAVELNYRWPNTIWKSRGQVAEGLCCVGFVCGAAMLLNMDVMRKVGFFDETFFLYYEDDDLCQRVFSQRKEIILVPEISVHHFSRGSVRGKKPLRSEFLRGYHHAQSKIIFERKHVSERSAYLLRFKTLIFALLSVPVRLIYPQPKYLARLLGRIFGLLGKF